MNFIYHLKVVSQYSAQAVSQYSAQAVSQYSAQAVSRYSAQVVSQCKEATCLYWVLTLHNFGSACYPGLTPPLIPRNTKHSLRQVALPSDVPDPELESERSSDLWSRDTPETHPWRPSSSPTVSLGLPSARLWVSSALWSPSWSSSPCRQLV